MVFGTSTLIPFTTFWGTYYGHKYRHFKYCYLILFVTLLSLSFRIMKPHVTFLVPRRGTLPKSITRSLRYLTWIKRGLQWEEEKECLKGDYGNELPSEPFTNFSHRSRTEVSRVTVYCVFLLFPPDCILECPVLCPAPVTQRNLCT